MKRPLKKIVENYKFNDIITGSITNSRNQLLLIEEILFLNHQSIPDKFVYYYYEKTFEIKGYINQYQLSLNFQGSINTQIIFTLDGFNFFDYFTKKTEEKIVYPSIHFKDDKRNHIFKIQVKDFTTTNFLIEYSVNFSYSK